MKTKSKPQKKETKVAAKKIKGPVASVAHAFKILGQKEVMPIVSMLPKQDQDSLLAYYKITKIIEAENKLNNNWQPNWSDYNQPKYCVWKEIKADAKRPAGFGFSCTDYDDWGTITTVGSRLLVGERETALRIGEKFEKLFIQWMLILK